VSLYTEIRGALQARAVATPGFPGALQRAYEGRPFNPTLGTPYAALTLLPTAERPADIAGDQARQDGLFQIGLFYPANAGETATLEALADAVRARFTPTLEIERNGVVVVIDYAERGPIIHEGDWMQLPVTIRWHRIAAEP
jgi:hypothetical protein